MRIFYNVVAPVYDLVFGARTPWAKDFRKQLVRKLGLKKGDKVLEVGIGTGANIPYISEKVGEKGRIFGMDISESMLRKCSENLKKENIGVELKLGTAERLPYGDNEFDAVLQFGGINFFNDRKKAVEEMFRVAKIGARIVIGDETIPLKKTYEPVMAALPSGASETRLEFAKGGIKFWIISTRKKA